MTADQEPEKKKRGPLTATERLIEARDQQRRYVDRLSERRERRRVDLILAETQLRSAVEELERIEAALPSELRQKKPQGYLEIDVDPKVSPKVASVLDKLHHGPYPPGVKPRC